MSLRTKVSAAVVGAATIGGMLVAAPGAFADECWKQPNETRICTAYPGSGGELRLYTYPPASAGADYKMQGTDSLGRPVHLDRAKAGGWDGPLGGGNGSTAILSRQGTAWRACVNVGNNQYHCTVWA
ncbi:hypothetical protein [Amycolatopsis tolypomycina]|uniref:Peptidase inhibitor family I36 n=1 Tax=Amycolatopsis tolypomycina TaxID=208445 RepID=A0A1H5C5B2_9PSEU|nr:hypothetical protein [Amycolatopsis tolypomycina]SED61775.1 hypothetical protein SAMN04489727_8601 [Amycolatopsis tolypomycina]